MKNGHTTKAIINGQIVEKPKKPYETDKEAIESAKHINLKSKTIHKLVAYKCSVCQKWHIGRNKKELTDKDRDKYRKTLLIDKL